MLQRVNDIIQGGMCAILNVFWRYTKNISPNLRRSFLTISFMMISICAYCYTIIPVSVHLLWKCIIGAFFMFWILIFSIDRELKPVKWNTGIVVLWIIFGLLRLVSGFTASIEFFPLACIWLVGFPLIFFVWNNRKDYFVLFDHIYTGFLYPTIIFFSLSLFFVPMGEDAYTGITGNPNSVGQHISAIFPLIFGRFLLGKNDSKKKKILNILCMFLSISFAFYSRGRTITLVIAGVCLIGFFACVLLLKFRIQDILKKIAILIVGSVAVTVICIPLNGCITAVLPNYSIEAGYEEETTQLGDVVSGYLNRVEGKDKAAPGINNYSSGRIGIWKEAISKLRLSGNPSRNHIVTDRNGDMGNNAHNVFIQFAYDNGIIAGVCFIILVLSSLITIVRGCFAGGKHKELYIIILLVSVSYLCEAIVTSVNLPFLYVVSFVYYFIYAVLFDGTLKGISNNI